jgi:hypothetical protein
MSTNNITRVSRLSFSHFSFGITVRTMHTVQLYSWGYADNTKCWEGRRSTQRPKTVDHGSLINDNANRILRQLFADGFLDRSENVSAALLPCSVVKKPFSRAERVSGGNRGTGCQLINTGNSNCRSILRPWHVNSVMLWRKRIQLEKPGHVY